VLICKLPHCLMRPIHYDGNRGKQRLKISIFFPRFFGLLPTETEQPTQLAHHICGFIGVTNFDMRQPKVEPTAYTIEQILKGTTCGGLSQYQLLSTWYSDTNVQLRNT
jgi:hypothetical protein